MCGFDCLGCPRCTPGFGALEFPRNGAGEIVMFGLTLTELGHLASLVLAAGAVYGLLSKRR